MMGYQEPLQSKLFYTGFNIDQKVRKNHPLRNIHKVVDFEFIYKEVADTYGGKGEVKKRYISTTVTEAAITSHEVGKAKHLLQNSQGSRFSA